MSVMSYIEQYLYWTPFNSFQTISERHSKKQYEWLVLGTTKIDFGDDPLFRVNTSQVGIWVVFEVDIAILSKIEEDSIFLESENSFVEDQGKLHPTQKGT